MTQDTSTFLKVVCVLWIKLMNIKSPCFDLKKCLLYYILKTRYLHILSHTSYHENVYSKYTCCICVTNYYNVNCSLCQYMSMYVYCVNNGDGNLNCIICAWSCLWQINMVELNYNTTFNMMVNRSRYWKL